MAITAEDLKKLSPGMKAALVFFACLLIGYFYYFFYLQNALVKKGNLDGKLEKLQVDSWTKGDDASESSDDKFYIEIPIRVKVLGTFPNTLEFFDKISQLPRIINVEDLVLNLSKEGKD